MSLHDVFAVRVLQPAYRASRAVRPQLRPQLQAFGAGMRFRDETVAWDEARRRAWVLDRLRFVVRRAAAETPFYRARLADAGFDPAADFTFDEYARLPVLERADVHAAGRALRSTLVPAAQLRRDASGGSTGTPTEVWTGPEERGWGESASEWFMRRIGVPTGSRTAYLWGHHLDPVARSGLRDRLHDVLANARWYDCLRLSSEVLAGFHADLQRFRPQVIVAYASSLAALAEIVARDGAPPAYPGSCFVTGAEKLFPEQRARVQSAFGRLVHERYGGRDFGLVGFQLDPARTLDFTVDWANALVEPEGAPDADGIASLLVTKLHGDGMPMLRYRIGDMARFPAGARAGHPAFRLHEIVGREADRLWLPDGTWAHGLGFPHLLKDFPVRDFQVVQRASYDVEIRIVADGGFDDSHESAILRLVRANLPGVTVTLHRVTEIPRTKANKWRPVMSEAVAPAVIPRPAGVVAVS